MMQRWVTSGLRVGLRPLSPTDFEWIDSIEMGAESLLSWRHHGTTPEPRSRRMRLWVDVVEQLVVETREGDHEPVGLVSCYSADLRSQHAYIAVLSRPEFEQKGLATAGLVLLIEHLFGAWPFLKLYAEVSEYNFDSFAHATDQYFTVEAQMKQYEKLGSQWWDRYILAIHRDAWQTNVSPLLARRIRPKPRPQPTG